MYKKILKKITALFLAGAMVLPGLTVRAGSEDEIAVNTEENVTIDREHFPDEKVILIPILTGIMTGYYRRMKEVQ